MGAKRVIELLDGVTGTGAGQGYNIGQYQGAMMVEVKTTAGTADFTVQLQYEDGLGNWEAWHEEVVTTSTDDPLNVQLEKYPWNKVRAEITAYTSGTISAYAYPV